MSQSFYAEPFISTPLIKHLPSSISAQLLPRCGKFELQVVNCIEAYGWDRGRIKCAPMIEDFYECLTYTKQKKRIIFMAEERNRQMEKGQRNFLPTPPVDLY